MSLFSKLAKINYFEFESSSGEKSQTGWNGYAKGSVITKVEQDSIYFKEQGYFKLDKASREAKIENEYIWQKIDSNRIRLFHARFGYNNLVNLFDLVPKDKDSWHSENQHVCVDDLYSAELSILDKSIELSWKIVGPKKNELIKYMYLSKNS
ncbi:MULTISPECIES: DUF6314 family protein [unclassified Francisella]|uniref:DUF6314 family protein n=1 Tax=unclassified Francisella TaxID=2610885 RepID=UPI002E2EAFA4|nr:MULTISPECIES: DUF6314 family protein [unclassified Francisella]MED7820251.1 DUF6314 family protein [Francisella sp. 19S2-4]MED7831086.1 DUF6314 family protein [Francisella sp. 19S2-10]